MSIITLTSDWNKRDYYLGVVKGKILSHDTSVTIVDINHNIQQFSILQAAFVLRNCYHEFPENTIHLVCINTDLIPKRKMLVIKIEDQYILTSDNGIVKLLTGDKEFELYTPKNIPKDISNKNVLDLFIDTAFHILNKRAITEFCNKVSEFEEQIPLRPVLDKNLINGSIIYIDSYSNAITNISKETFTKTGKGNPFEILVQSNHYKIESISNSYSDVPAGEMVALFNSIGLLELAINHGNISELLNLNTNSIIRIKFYDGKSKSELKLTGG